MALDVQRIPIEIQFAQGLAGNEQKNRDKTLGLLRKFIRLRLPRLKEQLNEDEFIKLWKGMHYQLWMQDKPLIQEKLVDDLCELVHDFPNETYTLMFIKAFFVTEAREWYGLDQWRMNKFMMLVREFLHNSFLFLKKYEWKQSICQELGNILEESVMNCRNIDLPIGLKLHLMDIFHAELRKVADDKLSSDTAVILLSPFLNVLPTVKNDNVMKKLLTMLFEAGGGRECPKAKSSRKSDESDGSVECDTSQTKGNKLMFNRELLLKQLMEKGSRKKCPAKIRSQIYKLIKRIRYLENRPQKPIKIVKEKDVDLNDVEVSQRDILAAVRRLKKNKEELLEKVPLRKEYKLNLLMEKKSKKAEKEVKINDVDTEEEEDDGIDMEGYDDDDDDDNDSLEFDAEAEFFQMSTEDEEGYAADDLSDDNCLPENHIEDEPMENEELESPVLTEEESPVATKKNKKSGKAGSKRKNEESLDESASQAPEKKGKKTKVDDIAAAAVEDAEEMEVAVTEEKTSKKRKRKSRKKSGETSVSSEVSGTKPMFGMVDFPEEEEDSLTEGMNETEAVVLDTELSPEEDSKSEEKAKKKKVKKVKQKKKTKKTKIAKEPLETNDESEDTAGFVRFPLPTDAKDTDVSKIETQNALQLSEHLKKLKEKKEQSVETKNKGKSSRVNRYFNQVPNEVDSKEMEAINSNVVEEEKDSPGDQEEGEVSVPVNDAEVPVIDAEVPVMEEETKTTGKGKLKLSLVVKGKKGIKIKGQKVSAVEKESGKPEPESDSSEEWDKLYEHPPAFLRNAVAKAGKPKKSKKSKNVKTEKSASPKKTTKTTVSPGGKRVSFNMEQNKALAFRVGTRIKNDENAFHPSKKPENGILKPSPSPIRISKRFSMDKKLTMLSKSSFMTHFF